MQQIPCAAVGRLIGVLLALAPIALAGSVQAPNLAQTPAYAYDANGRFAVIVSPDEVLVRAENADGTRAVTRPASLPPAFIPDALPPAAAALEQAMTRRGLHVVRGVSAPEARAFAGVTAAFPILYRVGSAVPIYMTDELVVAFLHQPSDAELQELENTTGCSAAPRPYGLGRVTLTVRDPAAIDTLALANQLQESGTTLYAHPDFLLPKVTCSVQIDDPLYYLQWHLDGDVSKGAAPGSDINVEAAWDSSHGADSQGIASVRVAILDECVEKWHEDLLPNWAAGRDYDNDPYDDDPSPDAGQKHGTSCAGVAVAKANNLGVRGACPNCGLIGVKFFGATIAEQADSYYFCMDPDNDGDHSDGAAILSNSWGYADGALLPTDMQWAIDTVSATGRNGKGCLVLFAAANNDHTVNGVSALAQLASVVCVGGTNSNAEHTEFSDVGPEVAIATPTNDRGDDGVRLPWIDITTVDNMGTSGYNGLPDLNYTNAFGGTSSATPLAAGVLGLIISQDPNMTASAALAILQHTAVPVDAPYDRADPITGHSDRLGFGKADAGAAVAAADAGLRWPARIKTLTASAAGANNSLIWNNPTADFVDTLVVRSRTPFGWRPTDGVGYTVGQEVAPGVFVLTAIASNGYLDPADSGGYFYAVYPRSAANLYGFGAKAHLFRDGFNLFYDDGEIPDPGWTSGGAANEWKRGTPTSANSIFGQVVVGSGPLRGTRGVRAVNGDNCWGTDLNSTYNAYSNAWLRTPLLNLDIDPNIPVFLDYWDWALMETYYDQAVVEVTDAAGNIVGTLDADTAGDHDWMHRVYDLSPFIGQAVHVQFRLVSDGAYQRDGWFIDEVKIVVAGAAAVPPVAQNVLAETPANTAVIIQLDGNDPNPQDQLAFIITSLPAYGTLADPGYGPIATVPYTLQDGGLWVQYTPVGGYEGPDVFTYHISDGTLFSNTANVSLSVGTPVLAYDFPLNTNPNWLTEGLWEFGQPHGFAGDPTTGYTGLNVYGYNLDGAYENLLPPTALVSEPFNCTGLTRVTLRFARWLTVESSSYDAASVEVSTDGVNWLPAWTHTGGDLEDTAWSVQEYNIGAVANDAPFVQVRWVMGPTDTEVNFGGWNVDDVQILAIGTPVANQPPFARPGTAATATDDPVDITLVATDAGGDPLTYIITTLPDSGTLTDPVSGVVDTTPYVLTGNTVTYLPNPSFGGTDTFSFQASDGVLLSNAAPISIGVVNPAPFPFADDFEAGPPLGVHWSTATTGTGRIVVTDAYSPIGQYHVVMDSSYAGNDSSNALTLAVNLAGHSNVLFSFAWKDFGDENQSLPDTWVGSAIGDGLAVSEDGVTWHKVMDLFDGPTSYQTILLDLDQIVADLGLTYTKTFRIRWQQYDDQPATTDGFGLDNIALIQGTSDPVITTTSLPTALLNLPYDPVTLTAAGGDLPLTWSLLDTYGETELQQNDFAAGGVGQGWLGGNSYWTYDLPFNFPFYDQVYSQVIVGSDGWLNFGPVVGATYANSALLLSYNIRIAVLWDNLRTDNPGNDIFIDESQSDRVTIRWAGVTHATLEPVNFSCTLFADGRIRCAYGTGNTSLTPTLGVSAGDTANYTLSVYDEATSLTNANSIEFQYSELPLGLTLAPNGVISGTPTTSGVYRPVFHVADNSGRTNQRVVPLSVIPDLLGDLDRNGVVDIADLDLFAECLTGPGVPILTGCEPADFAGDLDVDLADYYLMQPSIGSGN